MQQTKIKIGVRKYAQSKEYTARQRNGKRKREKEKEKIHILKKEREKINNRHAEKNLSA